MEWKEFTQRLARELMHLPANAFLVVQVPGGFPYAQAMRYPTGLSAEVVSNEFLPPALQLGPDDERLLQELDWHVPGEHGHVNWWQQLTLPGDTEELTPEQSMACGRLGASMAAALHRVFGVRAPGDLEYRANRNGPDGGPMELPYLGIPPVEPVVPRAPEAESHALDPAFAHPYTPEAPYSQNGIHPTPYATAPYSPGPADPYAPPATPYALDNQNPAEGGPAGPYASHGTPENQPAAHSAHDDRFAPPEPHGPAAPPADQYSAGAAPSDLFGPEPLSGDRYSAESALGDLSERDASHSAGPYVPDSATGNPYAPLASSREQRAPGEPDTPNATPTDPYATQSAPGSYESPQTSPSDLFGGSQPLRGGGFGAESAAGDQSTAEASHSAPYAPGGWSPAAERPDERAQGGEDDWKPLVIGSAPGSERGGSARADEDPEAAAPTAPIPIVRADKGQSRLYYAPMHAGGVLVTEQPPITDPAEVERLVRYLRRGTGVLNSGFSVDEVEPERGEVVPVVYLTDGTWVWSAAQRYYLENYGIPPHPAFYEHIAAQGYQVPDVPDHLLVEAGDLATGVLTPAPLPAATTPYPWLRPEPEPAPEETQSFAPAVEQDVVRQSEPQIEAPVSLPTDQLVYPPRPVTPAEVAPGPDDAYDLADTGPLPQITEPEPIPAPGTYAPPEPERVSGPTYAGSEPEPTADAGYVPPEPEPTYGMAEAVSASDRSWSHGPDEQGSEAGAYGGTGSWADRREEPVHPDRANLEAQLEEARARGDHRSYFGLIVQHGLFLPASPDPHDGHFATADFNDGTYVLAYTSPTTMAQALGGPGYGYRRVWVADLVAAWPKPEWRLAINAGLSTAAFVDAESIEELAGIPAQQQQPQSPTTTVQSPEVQRPTAPADTEWPVMQKVVPPEHVVHYLQHNYDRVCGYVYRYSDVKQFKTPALLVDALGLIYEGSPFSPDDETIHALRWIAAKPNLSLAPTLRYADDGIPEFRIDSQRLPHGAELYRLDRTGRQTLVAVFDADRRGWKRWSDA